jgi:hypothetical protein
MADALEPSAVRRGCVTAWTIDFGCTWEGYTPAQLCRGSAVGMPSSLPVRRVPAGVPDDTSERVGVDLLNVRLQRRHAADMVGDGAAPHIGADTSELDDLLAGIHSSWAKGRIKCQPAPFKRLSPSVIPRRERAGHMPHHGHFSMWHVDALARLTDGWLTPGSEALLRCVTRERFYLHRSKLVIHI